MQLFEIFEYLSNLDLPGDWHTIHRVCVPTPPTPLTTAQELMQAPVSTVTSDHVITAGGKHQHSTRSVERWALSVLLWSTWWYWSCQHDTVTLALTCCMLSRQRRARQKNHLSLATATLTGRPSSATWVVHHTHRMQEKMHKICFTHLWECGSSTQTNFEFDSNFSNWSSHLRKKRI